MTPDRAPLCPACLHQSDWTSPPGTEEADTWSCPSCRRFGMILPASYLSSHPREDAVHVIGVDPRGGRRTSARRPCP